ncbi:DUF2867 domain-containing protein [Xanthomonas euroxanthea]|uniref:DUF2867 domain-containing protein n=1 Tax=Xanthomonas euroxanthea TaxID=2259622 RepID=UPI0021A4016E|nr:DUF2867 domain-containing protein [Xanthomonas euroxanthea]
MERAHASASALRRVDAHTIVLTMATQVSCRNRFGHLHMAAIHRLHRHYILPAMLRAAVQPLLHVGQRPDAGRPTRPM